MSHHSVSMTRAREELLDYYHRRRRTGPRTRSTSRFLHASRRHMPPPSVMERDYQRHVRRGRQEYPRRLFDPHNARYGDNIRIMTDLFRWRQRRVNHANRMREHRLAGRATQGLPAEVRDRVGEYLSPWYDRINYRRRVYTNEPEYLPDAPEGVDFLNEYS